MRKGRTGGASGRELATAGRFNIAAIDLGTNNCRLLIASASNGEYRIIDAFSRIVRLGEGVSSNGRLSENAIKKTFAALRVCADKLKLHNVTRTRCIATQACRGAKNGQAFLDRVYRETGLEFDIVTPEEEATLSVKGCEELLDPSFESALIFDIGGGSTELSWLRLGNVAGSINLQAWTSLPFGVVSLAEEIGSPEISQDKYSEIVARVRRDLQAFGDPSGLRDAFIAGNGHLLGTSGTVTSIAGIFLALPRYKRDKVDGLWLTSSQVREVAASLLEKSFDERAAEPCIGPERADLVVCGCAILEALLDEWPANKIRVADRGLREGILADLAIE